MNCICCKNWGKCPLEEYLEENDCFPVWASVSRISGFWCKKFIPGFITPAQYKERTEQEYPERAAVYCHFNGEPNWYVGLEKTARKEGAEYVVCALGGLVPPDDWRPDLFQ